MITSPQHKLNSILRAVAENPIDVGLSLKLSGRYQLTVTRDGQITQQTPWFDNLVLNQGKDRLGTAGLSPSTVILCQYAHVGTGTSTAVATQTQLDAFVASAVNSAGTSTNSGSPNYITTNTQSYAFAQGAVVGNISEVGVGSTSTNGNLFSRARIVDGSNNPTTLALTSIDQLTVVYALSFVPVLTGVSGSVTLASVAYPYTAYQLYGDRLFKTASTVNTLPSVQQTYPFLGLVNNGVGTNGYLVGVGASSYANPIGTAYPTLPPGSYASASFVPTDAAVSYSYTAGSYTGLTTVIFPPSIGNFAGGGIKGIILYLTAGNLYNFYVWITFTNPIPKDNTKQLTLTFSTSWS